MSAASLPFRKARWSDINGTSLVGYLRGVDYQDLVEALGFDAGATSDGKVRAEWMLRFADGTVATIYDWKSDRDLGDVVEWNVGGRNRRALDLVRAAVGRGEVVFAR